MVAFDQFKSGRPLLRDVTSSSRPDLLEYATQVLYAYLYDYRPLVPWLLLRREEAALEAKGYLTNPVVYG